MKGLVGGIPLALLVAAVANGYGIGQGHGDAGHDGPTTLIGGPSGDDGGNSAAIEFDSSYSSKVKDTYKDDHSFHLKNNVIAPPMPGWRKRGHGDDGHDGPTTVIGGPSGNDGGNDASIEFDSSYSSVVEDWYKDDHSVGIKNHIIHPPPMTGFRKRGHGDDGHDGPTTVIGGPSGDDGGNSVSIEFDSSYSSVVDDWYKDDHSFNEKNHIVSPPPMHGFRRRGDRGATVIGGPSGDDGGNSAEVEFDSSYASSVKDWYKDDHSIDINNHIIHKRQGNTVIGGPSGDDGGNSAEDEFDGSYASSVKDWYKDDHSIDIDNHIVHPPVPGYWKRQKGTLIGGPSGNDGGNSAEAEFDSSYASSVKDWYKDDHSIDIDNHIVHPVPGYWKRQKGTVIGGPSGDDGGNSAEVEFDSTYTSSIKDSYKDDHSVDIKNNIIHPPPVYWKRQRGSVIGGPSGDDGGNSAEVEFESSYASSVKDWYKDDHSVDIKNNIIHPGYWKRDDGGNHISSPHHNDGDAEVGDGKHSKHKGNTLIGGPSGNDGDGIAEIESDSDYSSEVEDHYKDDHSVDIKNTIIHPGYWKRDDGGNHISSPHHHDDDDDSEVKDHGKHHKHKGDALIGGPSGNDGGGSAEIEFDSDYSSEVEDHYKDDHSVDIKNHIIHPPPIPGFRRRGDGPFVTGGRSDGPEFVSGGPIHPGPILIGGPGGDDGGNSANIVFDSDSSSNVDDHYEDDHSVKEENWIVQPPAHPHPPPAIAKPEPPAPAPSKPCTTSTYLETIVKTLPEEAKPTKPGVPEHSQVYEPKPSSPSYPSYSYHTSSPSYPTHTSKPSHSYKPSSSSYPAHSYPAVPVYKPSSPSYQTHASEAVPSGVSPTHEPEGPKAEYDPGYSKSRPPCTSPKAQAHYEPPAPSHPAHADPVYSAPAEPAYEPTTKTPCPSRKPSAPSYPAQETANAQPVYSDPTTTPCTSRKPTETHAQPVYSAPAEPAHEPKPQPTTTPCTTRKPAHTSVEPVTSTSTITVSRTSFHTSCTSAKAHRPSDVDAEHAPSPTTPSHSAKTPYPTPSHSMMFTGAAGRMTPAAGVVSAVCGLMAVLAFVL